MAIQGYPQATICSRIKKNLYAYIFQFLLRQAFADDEASTILLQILLFLLLSTSSLMFIPCAYGSESWCLRKEDERRILVAEMSWLRRILGRSRRDRIRNEVTMQKGAGTTGHIGRKIRKRRLT